MCAFMTSDTNDVRMIDGVIVVSDLMRPDGNCCPGGKDRATLWLWNALKRPVYLASGLGAEALTTTGTPALAG